MRGTCSRQHRRADAKRFIPTSAGNICTISLAISSSAVHPHECGEHPLWFDVTACFTGSSPRVRGTLTAAQIKWQGYRFIPTSAGNIASSRACSIADTVHPHECGEHALSLDSVITLHGSSPRVRGTSIAANIAGGVARFIPTSAGNISVALPKLLCASVHPHECGEHRIHAN